MSTYTFTYENETFVLDSNQCGFYLNDEEKPIKNFDLDVLFDILGQTDEAYFDQVYYDQRCENCGKNRKEGTKVWTFLECHFYLFSLDQSYVMSSLSLDYEYNTLPDLEAKGLVDGTYLISINVCPECGDYTVDLEYGLF